MEINKYNIAISKEDLITKLTIQSVDINLISKDFEGYQNLEEGDKKALDCLVRAAYIIDEVAMEQDHHMNLEMREALILAKDKDEYANLALGLFESFKGVEGDDGVSSKPVEIFEGISGYKGRNFYPNDLSVEEFHDILLEMLNLQKTDEVKNILSARSMVRRKGHLLEAIDYTKYFAHQFAQVAEEFMKASEFVTNQDFAEYLRLQSKALLENDEELDMYADMKWAELQDTELELTLSRENYDDMMTTSVFDNGALLVLLNEHNIEPTSKDMLGLRVGIVNKEGTKLIMKFKEGMKDLVNMMPLSEKYEQKIGLDGDINQTMVDVDLVCLKGDHSQCRGGITTAENLPNNDKLSIKRGGGRRNVYHRQVRMSVDAERDKNILKNLVSSNLHQYYDNEMDHIFVIGHENGHSFGPNSVYQNSLGKHKHIIEELKADVISLAYMDEYAKQGVIDEKTLQKIYVTNVIKRCFLPSKPNYNHPHRVADLIIFNYLLENKVVGFGEDKKLNIDFSKFSNVMRELTEETIAIQLSKSPFKAENFIKTYSTWNEESQRISGFLQSLGLKPYKIIKTHFENVNEKSKNIDFYKNQVYKSR